jgi:hypothetical protein
VADVSRADTLRQQNKPKEMLVRAELQIATVRNQVLLSLLIDFENFSVFKPDPQREASVNAMLDQVMAWGGALKTLRNTST